MAHEYVGGGIVTRRASLQPETSMYRVVGVAHGTQLSWDPAPPPGAPTSLSPGQVVEFETKTLFHVEAQDEDPSSPLLDNRLAESIRRKFRLLRWASNISTRET